MALKMPEQKGSALPSDAEYEVDSVATEDVEVTTFSTGSVDTRPELRVIRERLETGTISKVEIREALLTANPNLLNELRAAKTQTDRRRNQLR